METKEMKVDPARIRAMRMDKAWSQEHLASLAGLSVRTIQRIETSGMISLESMMAIASAFDVEVQALALQPAAAEAETSTMHCRDYRAPTRGARRWLVYALVCGALVAINLYQHGRISWSVYPLVGWGAILLLLSILPRQGEKDGYEKNGEGGSGAKSR